MFLQCFSCISVVFFFLFGCSCGVFFGVLLAFLLCFCDVPAVFLRYLCCVPAASATFLISHRFCAVDLVKVRFIRSVLVLVSLLFCFLSVRVTVSSESVSLTVLC